MPRQCFRDALVYAKRVEELSEDEEDESVDVDDSDDYFSTSVSAALSSYKQR
jgi:hypothetical protein